MMQFYYSVNPVTEQWVHLPTSLLACGATVHNAPRMGNGGGFVGLHNNTVSQGHQLQQRLTAAPYLPSSKQGRSTSSTLVTVCLAIQTRRWTSSLSLPALWLWCDCHSTALFSGLASRNKICVVLPYGVSLSRWNLETRLEWGGVGDRGHRPWVTVIKTVVLSPVSSVPPLHLSSYSGGRTERKQLKAWHFPQINLWIPPPPSTQTHTYTQRLQCDAVMPSFSLYSKYTAPSPAQQMPKHWPPNPAVNDNYEWRCGVRTLCALLRSTPEFLSSLYDKVVSVSSLCHMEKEARSASGGRD